LGYLYQLLGSASIRVSLEEGEIATGDTNAVIVEIEEHGQDAIIHDNNTLRLIQFKHSQSARDISPDELAHLLTTFEQSEVNASAETAVEWILQTNRSLSATSEALLNGTPPGKKTRTKASALEKIRRLGARLRIEQHTLHDFEDRLRDRAMRFGIDDITKVTDGVIGLLHRTVVKPKGQRQLKTQVLDDALAGCKEALSIRASECTQRLRQQLVAIANEQGGIELTDALSRPSVEQLLQQDFTALAVVTGPGGSGKTLSLLKALYDSLDRVPRLVGALMPPPSAWSQTLQQLVASWRSKNGMPAESLGTALRRINVANVGSARPVLILCLDGLDESRWTETAHTDELLWHFFEMHQRPIQPDALLIVTCRTRQQLDELLAPQGTGRSMRRLIPEVRLDEFSVEEVRTVWERWFSGEALPPVGPASDYYGTLNQATNNSLSSDVAKALRHPVLLGCLRDWSPEGRAQLIAGNDGQWQQLLQQYIQWFSTKVTRRRTANVATVRNILRAAAVATQDTTSTTTFDMQTHWIGPGSSDTGEPRGFVKEVFEDAVTAGIVDSGEKRFDMPTQAPVAWKWHFAFVPKHLRTLP